MDVRLVYFDDCPHWIVAEQRVRTALDQLGQLGRTGQRIRHDHVATPAEAERLRFIGSPTVLVADRDPLASGAGPWALACRMDATPDGRSGSPTVAQPVEVLS